METGMESGSGKQTEHEAAAQPARAPVPLPVPAPGPCQPDISMLRPFCPVGWIGFLRIVHRLPAVAGRGADHEGADGTVTTGTYPEPSERPTGLLPSCTTPTW